MLDKRLKALAEDGQPCQVARVLGPSDTPEVELAVDKAFEVHKQLGRRRARKSYRRPAATVCFHIIGNLETMHD